MLTAVERDDLAAWLEWQARLHPRPMELGLERVRVVAERCGLLPLAMPAVVVAGTNGKGSTVAFIEAMLRARGDRVGCYTSPHLCAYNERVRVDGEPASDRALCEAFAAVEAARGDISLSFFEFGTLAALHCFRRSAPDVVLLEVGLGGRLDAVNIVDAAVAVVTCIDIDHTEWLGHDRETIGVEKAGIMRPRTPVVCSDPAPPASIAACAARAGARLYQLGRDFSLEREVEHGANGAWRFESSAGRVADLPAPALFGRAQLYNAAGALMAARLLGGADGFAAAARAGLRAARCPGRCHVEHGGRLIIDVAHNPHGAAALADSLQLLPCAGKTRAVFGVMRDKDCDGIFAAIGGGIDDWHLAAAASKRARPADELVQLAAAQALPGTARAHRSVAAACRAAAAAMGPEDRLVVFGSTQVAGEALAADIIKRLR